MKLGKKKIIGIVILLVVAVATWFFFIHTSKPKTPQTTVAVTKGPISEQAEAIGYIKPKHYSTVKSQIDGKVAAIYHEEGELVKKGEALLKVNPTPSPTAYATAYQEVVRAKIAVLSAKHDFSRLQDALKSGLISKNYNEYIKNKQAYETSKVALKLAEQKLALLQQGKTLVAGKEIENIVPSPIDGFILTRSVDVGDPVMSISSAQSSTTLYTVANMHDLMFEGTVDERDAAKIKLKMQAEITIGSMPQKKITGVLTKIALQSDRENANQGVSSVSADSTSPFNVGFAVEISDLNIPKGLQLRSGYSATAKINIKTKKDVLLVPERVVQFENDKAYVLLPNGDKPEKRTIKIGLADGMNVEVLSGLKLGDKVVDQTITNDVAGSPVPRVRRR